MPTAKKPDQPLFFPTPNALRQWFAKNHERVPELWVGYYRKDSGRPGITWPESVDEALCYGWIDGIRKKVDDESYKVRFTPRRAKSTWSAVNIARVAALTGEGRMQPAGVAAFARRVESNSARYSFENRESARLSADDEREFRHDPVAWEFFQRQPAGYRRLAAWWVISAKRSETRRTRLQRIIAESRARRRI
ncbi:MAG: YdeI/OmpD-associated family protein [Verrucomicrobiota bacterium]|nr:YdeI/OmpD-associated family protein [Verrucomicrobiota bacterium]